jgi:hypothetical protein
MSDREPPLKTPDGRYIVVRGRPWRASNPSLPEDERQRLVDELMDARRAVKDAKGDKTATAKARRRVDEAKTGLRERGPVWWGDGAPDLNKRLVKNTVYADWWLCARSLVHAD